MFSPEAYTQSNVKSPSPANEEEFIQDADRYVELFASRNPLFSLHSLDYISYFGDKAVPALLRGLKHTNSHVRCFSAIALGKIPDKRAVGPLIDLLADQADIDLQILSDDGLTIHSSYNGPQRQAVRENSLRTLQIITGMNWGDFGKTEAETDALIQRWKDWWQKEKQGFVLPRQIEFSNTFSDDVVYPIPDYARYLQGVTVCLDPGHGGDAQQIGYKRGPSGNRESESNLRLTRYLKDFLKKCGASVLMTRDSDKFVELNDRPGIANAYNADIFVSIHHNWSPRYTAQATTIWYHANPDYNPASMDLARYIFQEFTQRIPLREMDKSMGLKSDYLIFDIGFAVLRNLSQEIPGVLCELAYFSNLETELKMRDPNFLKQEAYGVFLGIARYFYAGIPHWKVISPAENVIKKSQTEFAIQIWDGLESRKEWGSNKPKIFARHLVVELDGQKMSFAYDEAIGIVKFALSQPLNPGEHFLRLFIINLNKNNNFPKVYRFTVEKP